MVAKLNYKSHRHFFNFVSCYDFKGEVDGGWPLLILGLALRQAFFVWDLKKPLLGLKFLD